MDICCGMWTHTLQSNTCRWHWAEVNAHNDIKTAHFGDWLVIARARACWICVHCKGRGVCAPDAKQSVSTTRWASRNAAHQVHEPRPQLNTQHKHLSRIKNTHVPFVYGAKPHMATMFICYICMCTLRQCTTIGRARGVSVLCSPAI